MEISVLMSLSALLLSLLGIGFAGFALWFRANPPDVSRLETRLSSLSLELTDLADKTGQWIRRQAVRNTRDKAPLTDSDSTPGGLPADPRELKNALRARVRMIQR